METLTFSGHTTYHGHPVTLCNQNPLNSEKYTINAIVSWWACCNTSSLGVLPQKVGKFSSFLIKKTQIPSFPGGRTSAQRSYKSHIDVNFERFNMN